MDTTTSITTTTTSNNNPPPPPPPKIIIDLTQDHTDNDSLSSEDTSSTPPDAVMKYLDGSFFMTALPGHHQDRLKFSDLIDNKYLQAAIFSSFVWEEDWFFAQLPKTNLRLCLIAGQNHPVQIPVHLNQIYSITQVTPFMANSYGCMHVKLGILVYQTFVRLYIGSANLMEFDWSGIQNIVYVHDFPALHPDSNHQNQPFYQTQLGPLLNDLNVPKGIHSFLAGYNYTSFKGQLLTSRPGSYLTSPSTSTNEYIGSYGIARFVSAVQQLRFSESIKHLGPNTSVSLTASTSSVGMINQDYVHTWAAIVRGLYRTKDQLHFKLKVVFPTMNEGLNNKFGIPGAGTCCFQSTTWHNPKFMHLLLHTLSSNVPGYLSHCKTITILPSDPNAIPNIPTGHPIGLYYAGSHNFTKAAWGSFAKTTGKVYMNNYEAGVLFPIMTIHEMNSKFPVPYTDPQPYYASKSSDINDQIPWMQDLFR